MNEKGDLVCLLTNTGSSTSRNIYFNTAIIKLTTEHDPESFLFTFAYSIIFVKMYSPKLLWVFQATIFQNIPVQIKYALFLLPLCPPRFNSSSNSGMTRIHPLLY